MTPNPEVVYLNPPVLSFTLSYLNGEKEEGRDDVR